MLQRVRVAARCLLGFRLLRLFWRGPKVWPEASFWVIGYRGVNEGCRAPERAALRTFETGVTNGCGDRIGFVQGGGGHVRCGVPACHRRSREPRPSRCAAWRTFPG